jgi:hypothetical protein
MYKGNDKIYGILGVEERYSLVQGENNFMPSINVEAINIKRVS